MGKFKNIIGNYTIRTLGDYCAEDSPTVEEVYQDFKQRLLSEILDDNSEIRLNYDAAKSIVIAEENCWNEGLEGVSKNVLLYIKNTYPDLAKEYSYLDWPTE